MAMAVSAFNNARDIVLFPQRAASDEPLAEIGLPAERIMRWDRGVDTCASIRPCAIQGCLPAAAPRRTRSSSSTPGASPTRRAPSCWPTLSRAHAREPRLHLVPAGGGPEQDRRERVGAEHTTFLGWLTGDASRTPTPPRPLPLSPPQPTPSDRSSSRSKPARHRRGRGWTARDRAPRQRALCEADAEELAGAANRKLALLRERLTVADWPRCAGAPGSGAQRLGEGWRGRSPRRGAATFTTPRSRARRKRCGRGVAGVGLRRRERLACCRDAARGVTSASIGETRNPCRARTSSAIARALVASVYARSSAGPSGRSA